MSIQTTCSCGHSYSPQAYITTIADQPSDIAKCPACREELCLTTCDCGAELTSSHRDEDMVCGVFGISRDFMEFQCPECDKHIQVKIETRKARIQIAFISAIVMAVVAGSLTWLGGYPQPFVPISSLIGAVMGFSAFYMRILRPPIR